MTNKAIDEPPEFQYASTVEGSLAIMRAYNEATFLERMRPIMVEVTKELIRAGVDFSKVK